MEVVDEFEDVPVDAPGHGNIVDQAFRTRIGSARLVGAGEGEGRHTSNG